MVINVKHGWHKTLFLLWDISTADLFSWADGFIWVGKERVATIDVWNIIYKTNGRSFLRPFVL